MESGSVKELLDRMTKEDENPSAGSGGILSKDAVASSDTLTQLQEGFKKTVAHSEMLSNRFAEKTKSAPNKFVCLGCKTEYKRRGNLDRHWKSSKTECSEENGFELIKDVQITVEDRMTPENVEMGKKLAAAREAAISVAHSLNNDTKKSHEGVMDASRLMRFPIGGFEQALKKTDADELQKFTQMRFDRMTAPKRVMAIRELQVRNINTAIS